jgi:hypothetical protein
LVRDTDSGEGEKTPPGSSCGGACWGYLGAHCSVAHRDFSKISHIKFSMGVSAKVAALHAVERNPIARASRSHAARPSKPCAARQRVLLRQRHHRERCHSSLRGKEARKPLNIIVRWGGEFRGLGAARCPITLGTDQPIFGATRRGPMRAHIAAWTSRGGHVRGNGLGHLELAAVLDFFHFQQPGWK